MSWWMSFWLGGALASGVFHPRLAFGLLFFWVVAARAQHLF